MATLADLLIKIGIKSDGVDAGASEIESKMDKTWGRLQAGAAAGGLLVGAALATSIASGLDTEVATDQLVASLGATGEEAENLGRTAGALYNKGLGESAADTANAVEASVSSFDDLVGTSLEKVSEQVLNISKAFEIDVARAAQVAGQAVESGLAGDATEAVDLLTASLQRVPKAVREDLVDAVDEYGPFMSAVGIKGEKAFGLLVNASKKGMYGIDKTGDAIKEFGILATDMGSRSAAAYELIGMSQKDMTAELLAGGDRGAAAFDKIVAGILAIEDPVKQSQAALGLFGTPLEDLGVTEIPKFLGSLQTMEGGLGDVAGATDRLGETLNDNAKTKLEAFKRQAQSALVEQLAKAIPYIEATFGWFQRNSGWITPVATGLGILAAAITLVVLAQKAWNAALLVSPVTWIVAGILLLVGVIIYLATQTQFFQTIWKNVWGFLKAVGAWFAGPFANFFISMYNKVLAGLANMRNGFMQRLNAVKAAFTALKNHAVSAFNGLLAKGATFLRWINSLPGKMRSALSNLFSPLWTGFKSGLNRIIAAWNNLSFTIGGGSFMGMSIPSATISTPNVPMLAKGGIVTRPTLAMIGEGREKEAVIPLSKLPDVAGRGDKPTVVVQIVPGGEREFRRWINKTVRVKGALRAGKA